MFLTPPGPKIAGRRKKKPKMAPGTALALTAMVLRETSSQFSDFTRPALSILAYTGDDQALEFLKDSAAGSANSSWLDFFLGESMCGGDDGDPGNQSACDHVALTTHAAYTLGIPAMYTVRPVFFQDRRYYPNFPSLTEAEANWTAFKKRLPGTGVLGFWLGDEMGVTSASSALVDRIMWAASRIRADYPDTIIMINALCASTTGNPVCFPAHA